MTHSPVWHDSFRCVTMNRLYVWHDSFTYSAWLIDMCVAWLIYIFGMTHWYVCGMTHLHVWPRIIHACNMAHSYFGHDPFICVTWLLHMVDMTPSHGWHDSFTWLTWPIYIFVNGHCTGFARLVWGRLRVHWAFFYSDWFVCYVCFCQ